MPQSSSSPSSEQELSVHFQLILKSQLVLFVFNQRKIKRHFV
jgi:hypothetical protein